MTVRSVIDIDVNDESFERFKASFAKYREALDKTPAAWKESEKAAGGLSGHFADITAALMAQAALKARMEREEREQERAQRDADKHRTEEAKRQRQEVEAQQRATAKMKEDVRQIGRDALSAFENLGKWTTIGAGVLGGLTAGGLFGLDRLANSVGASRRSAQGLGVTTGQQQSFRINFGRYLDADANLQAIADTKTDLSQRYRFAAMGVNPNGKDPYQLATEMALRARDIYSRGDGSQQYAQAHGLLQFYSMDDLRRLKATPRAELERSVRQAGTDAQQLALSDQTNRKWQDFSIQLTRAGQQIENVLVDKLTPLVPELDKLSAAMAKTIGDLLSNPHIKEWMGELAQGIKKFADYIVTPKFQSDLKSLADRVGDAANKMGAILDGIYSVMQKLHLLPDTSPGADRAPPVSLADRAKFIFNPLALTNPYDRAKDAGKGAVLRDYFMRQGLSAAGAAAIAAHAIAESGGNPMVKENLFNHGHHGLFQWDKTRWAAYQEWSQTNDKGKGEDVRQADFALYELRTRMGKLYQELRTTKDAKGAAADFAQFERYGGWMDRGSADTRHRQDLAGAIAGVKVKIENQTGGSAVASASQLGAGG